MKIILQAEHYTNKVGNDYRNSEGRSVGFEYATEVVWMEIDGIEIDGIEIDGIEIDGIEGMFQFSTTELIGLGKMLEERSKT